VEQSRSPFSLVGAIVLLVALSSLSPPSAVAQDRVISSFDTNRDGTIDPKEVPEGARSIFERMVRRAGLDPTKPVSVKELEERYTAAAKAASEASPGSSPASGSATPAPLGAKRRISIRWPGQQNSTPPPGRSIGPIRPRVPPTSSPRAGLPAEFQSYDQDKDGQIGLYEWPRNQLDRFLTLDKNQDGFLVPSELPGGATRQTAGGGPQGAITQNPTEPARDNPKTDLAASQGPPAAGSAPPQPASGPTVQTLTLEPVGEPVEARVPMTMGSP
jgi:hypothetical protein